MPPCDGLEDLSETLELAIGVRPATRCLRFGTSPQDKQGSHEH